MIYVRGFCISKSFIVSGPIFRSLIHFKFIFVYGVRKCSFLMSQLFASGSQSTVSGNVNWYSHYGEQCGDSLKNWK